MGSELEAALGVGLGDLGRLMTLGYSKANRGACRAERFGFMKDIGGRFGVPGKVLNDLSAN